MAAKTYIEKGDYFKYFHPSYPSTKNLKPMKAERIDSTHVEPYSNDLVVRRYPLQYCTKIEVCNCTTMHYLHHMNTQDINDVCTMCNKQRI